MARIALIAQNNNRWANSILQTLSQARTTHECYFAELRSFCDGADASDPGTGYVYVPSLIDREGIIAETKFAAAGNRSRRWPVNIWTVMYHSQSCVRRLCCPHRLCLAGG